MGRVRAESGTPKHAPGIEVRKWLSGHRTIRIIFNYKGMRCRETLSIEPTKENLRYAERLRAEILNAITRGTFSYADFFPDSPAAKKFGHMPSDITIGSMLDEYLELVKDTRELSTYLGYKKLSLTHLYPVFSKIFVRDLKPAFIRNWVRSLNLTAKTISNILIPLRAILEQAVNDDMIAANPLSRVVVSRLLSKQNKKSSFKVEPFNKEEISAILDATSHLQIKNLIQFACFTGLRTSELIALEWNDIDWVGGFAHICRAKVSRQIKSTKTDAGIRDVMLLGPALDALKSQKQFTFMKGKTVFHNPFSDQEWECDHQIRKIAWIPTLKKAGVRYRNPYQTRHTYASTMLSAGENILWVANQMGHVDTEMVTKTYGRWIPDNTLKAGYKPMNNWSQFLGESINSGSGMPRKCPAKTG